MQKQKIDIAIAGRKVALQMRGKERMKGVTIGDTLAYRFYDGEYQGMALLFAEPKGPVASPRNLALTADKISSSMGLPVVYLLPSAPAYQRQRLIDRDVYFVVSAKYAHLPMLVANERIRHKKAAKALSPVAQYLLLYHLQVESLEGLSANDVKDKLPYSYASITLGMTCLEDFGLCEKVADGPKRKQLHFHRRGIELWKQAKPVLANPVEQKVYCDGLDTEEVFPVCGINALAHYTRLNPDPERMVMMEARRFRSLRAAKAMQNPNDYDGNIVIEVWKYPPVTGCGETPLWVDKLSLALSLQEDADARVESEVEQLINKMEWKD